MNICIIGGTGFVGSYLVNALASQGHSIKIISRRPERHRHLKTLPKVKFSSIDFFGSKILERQIDTYDVVINLAGILNPSGRNTFELVHEKVASRVAEATRAVGTPRLLHMSALNADENGTSQYLKSKGRAQKSVLATEGLNVTTFSPSVIFGPQDSFFNDFVSLLKLMPVFFPLTCSNARFAPIFVGDVVNAFIKSIDNPQTFGKNYDLCGPQSYSLYELVKYTAQQINSSSIIVPLNRFFSKPMVALLDLFPGTPITMDNYNTMKQDSICQESIADELGIELQSIESIVPQYLSGKDFKGHMDEFRKQARR